MIIFYRQSKWNVFIPSSSSSSGSLFSSDTVSSAISAFSHVCIDLKFYVIVSVSVINIQRCRCRSSNFSKNYKTWSWKLEVTLCSHRDKVVKTQWAISYKVTQLTYYYQQEPQTLYRSSCSLSMSSQFSLLHCLSLSHYPQPAVYSSWPNVGRRPAVGCIAGNVGLAVGAPTRLVGRNCRDTVVGRIEGTGRTFERSARPLFVVCNDG